jgi:hypothetical protein
MVGAASMITRFGSAVTVLMAINKKTELRRKRSHAIESEVTTHLVTRRRT